MLHQSANQIISIQHKFSQMALTDLILLFLTYFYCYTDLSTIVFKFKIDRHQPHSICYCSLHTSFKFLSFKGSEKSCLDKVLLLIIHSPTQLTQFDSLELEENDYRMKTLQLIIKSGSFRNQLVSKNAIITVQRIYRRQSNKRELRCIPECTQVILSRFPLSEHPRHMATKSTANCNPEIPQ